MKLSENTEKHFLGCRKLAERYNNAFISMHHFFIVHNSCKEMRSEDRMNYSELKFNIKYLKDNTTNKSISDDIPLTRGFQDALDFSSFFRWVLEEKLINPEHIILACVSEQLNSKEYFFSYVEKNAIQLGWLKKIMVICFCIPLIRKTGLFMLFGR